VRPQRGSTRNRPSPRRDHRLNTPPHVGAKPPWTRDAYAQIEDARREIVERFAVEELASRTYGGADVGVITYKSTREWLENEKSCFIPPFVKLLHWGDVAGTNVLQKVRALFVIGRPMPRGEDMTSRAEALYGAHSAERDYVKHVHKGQIPIVLDKAGNVSVFVDVWEHPNRIAEWLRRQAMEGAIIQAVGRARAGLRGDDEPL
jgi:hypothetical protein